MTQPPKKPALDNPNCGFDFRLVTRTAGSSRQNGAAVVSRHPGIGAIDLWIKMAGLDHRHLGIVRDEQCRSPAKSLKRQQVAFDPIWKRFAPAGMRKRKARYPEHSNEQMGFAAFSPIVDR
ncbi:hypothetical protein ACVII0_005177 [Sinorhizobium meliloti]